MPDFNEVQGKLSTARRSLEDAQRALMRTNDQIQRADAQLRELARRVRPDDQRAGAERQALEAQRGRLVGRREQGEAALGDARVVLTDLRSGFFDQWSDPRQNAGRMPDETPVLLFPLRLETRFKRATDVAGRVASQLWVRIYPDECLIDTFDETLSQGELDSVSMFWREYFHAAGVEAAERAAWRALVASHGSGRAAWIIRQYRPRNPLQAGDPEGDPGLATRPRRTADAEIFLVVSSEQMPAVGESAALAGYWEAVWRADRHVGPIAAALDDLVAAVGAARAGELVAGFKPYNLAEAPPPAFTRDTAIVSVSFLVLPPRADVDSKTRSWMTAARCALLPERFVLLGYQAGAQVLEEIGAPVDEPFAVSPDPATTPESQFLFDEHGNLALGDELAWMADFDEAVRRGMGFRVTLTETTAAGFDRLFVLGLRLGSDAARGQGELEQLLRHHYFSRAGFAFLPQGSPTNNTDEVDSAYTRDDDADASFDFVFQGKAQFTETDDWLVRSDGQSFAEALGLDTAWLKQVPHAGDVDQAEARAMNTALWPATFGYFMDSLLQPVFSDDAVYYTRWFFNRFVSGRGPIPAIRIGRQPYGILPTTAFTRMRWMSGDERPGHLAFTRRFQEERGTAFRSWLLQFKGIADRLHGIWRGLAAGVSHVGMDTADPHQTLLDIVGLHPASVEFHQRYAATKKQEHNLAAIWQLFVSWPTLPANELHDEAYTLLVELGYVGEETPLLFDLFWKVGVNRLNGPVIQEGALSETDPLRAITTDDRNYIEWLRQWAGVSFDTLRLQDGFQPGKSPTTLLYVLLKHALELGYHDAGVRALDDAGQLDAPARRALRSEPHFFQVSETAVSAAGSIAPSASRYEMLYASNARVTGEPRTLLVDYLTRNIGTLFGTRYLAEQLRALERLERTPTARLERLLTEHLDCATYRLDAWMTGLVGFQLATMRHPDGDENTAADGQAMPARKGIHLGAYGWLENVRPENKLLAAPKLDDELDEIFNRQQPPGAASPLMRDDTNEGYIHAPSLNHAITAAVLRNGYVANATPEQPDLLKVNLSSERVRLAMGMIEGIRNGQSLAALLGYQFERGLHDRHAFAECDRYIYPLRLAFPLYTDATDLPAGVTIEAVEARNVVNGLNLVRHVRKQPAAQKRYPFGFPGTKLPPATAAQREAIDAEVDRLLDMHDALADLAMAEGVHQVVLGNYDRAAATLDAFGQATFPAVPDVARTPRSGIVITHRIGLQFATGVVANVADNPRVRAEPAIDQWLSGVLPAPARIGCTVTYVDAATGDERSTPVTQADLGLQPLDLVYVLDADNLRARSELDDRIRDVVLRDPALAIRPDMLREVVYDAGKAGDFSFQQVAAEVRSLRALLLQSRTLRATDIAIPTEADPAGTSVVLLDRGRVDFLDGALAAIRGGALRDLLDLLQAALPDGSAPDKVAIVADIDDRLDDLVALCRDLALFAMPQTGIGIFQEGRAGLFTMVLGKARDITDRWQERLDEFDALMLDLAGVVDENPRIVLLLRAEKLVSTASTDPVGRTSAQVLAIVQGEEAAFRARHLALRNLQRTPETTIAGLFAVTRPLLLNAAFDSREVTTADEEHRVVVLAQDMLARVRQLDDEIGQRLVALQEKLVAHDAAGDPETRVQLLTKGARLMFGDDFQIVPSFTLPDAQAAEWANAHANRELLLTHQKTVLGNAFPVDDWLYGAARVRQKLHHLENLTFLAEAFDTTAPTLDAVQFPFDATACWMALEYPPDRKATLERELLLYTAHHATPFDPDRPQGGVLLDEWTEVIPQDNETTGVAFHFDRPNSEPPQAMLLVTPPQFTGEWQWSDLVATLHETLDGARMRAVEPAQLDQHPLAVFLPATVLATTWQPITIAADLSLVNKYASRIS